MLNYFSHGDLITAEKLNAIIAIINDVETQTQGFSMVSGGRDADIAGTMFAMKHTKRYLVYRSTGDIYDLSEVLAGVPLDDIENHTSLGDCGELTCAHDLHSIEWLSYGMMYIVEGCEFAMEDDARA